MDRGGCGGVRPPPPAQPAPRDKLPPPPPTPPSGRAGPPPLPPPPRTTHPPPPSRAPRDLARRPAEVPPAIRLHLGRQGIQHASLGGGIEIDQHIAAEDDVEPPQRAMIRKQVTFLEAHHLPQHWLHAPLACFLPKIFHQHLRRQ